MLFEVFSDVFSEMLLEFLKRLSLKTAFRTCELVRGNDFICFRELTVVSLWAAAVGKKSLNMNDGAGFSFKYLATV